MRAAALAALYFYPFRKSSGSLAILAAIRRASSPVSSQFVPSRLRPERTAQHQSRSPRRRRQIDCRRKIAIRREAKLSRRKIRSQLNSHASISLRSRATFGGVAPAAWLLGFALIGYGRLWW